MYKMIDEAHSFGIVSLVVFTGGEPFLLGEDLYAAVGYAANKGFLTRVVTNASWADSLDRAIDVLSRMKNLGLSEVNLSCDDFHQEFIPLERVRWANEAAEKVGIPCLIAARGLKNSTITPEYLDEFFGVKLARFIRGQDNPSNNLVSYGATVPVGWHSAELTDGDLLFPDDSRWKGPCSSVLKDIVLNEDGDLIACCGIGSEDIPEVVIGNTRESSLLDLLKQGNEDLILNWLALEGPYGIMRYIQKKAPEIAFRDLYVGTCHLCHDVLSRIETRTVLRKYISEKVLGLSFKRAWLETHRTQTSQ